MSLRVIAACLLLCMAFSTQAQGAAAAATAAQSPEAAATALYQAMKRKDWTGAAALFDPEALKEFRQALAPLFEAASADEASAAAISTLFGGMGQARLKAVSDAEFFAAFFGGVSAAAGVSLDSQQVLGSVAEHDDLRHVVTRNTASGSGLTLTKMEVVSTRRTADGWRILLSGDMKGMAQALKARMAAAGARGAANPADAD